MKRFHAHVSVENLADSIRFYSGMFGAEPTVLKPDYAKWKLEDPCINFAISQRGAKIGLDHLGIQVESDDELSEMQARLAAVEPEVKKEEGVQCCYARSDKYWVSDPSGIAWETFHSLDSIPVFGVPKQIASARIPLNIPVKQVKAESKSESACCVPSATTKQGSSCC
jgi:hypothetical protein